jgi:hypothetical protein
MSYGLINLNLYVIGINKLKLICHMIWINKLKLMS